MTRKAIIIGNNTGKDAPKHLGGVTHDLTNYQNYLKNVAGGGWYPQEIEILHNESKTKILEKINNCRTDYSFVVFTGHGFVNSKNGLTYACVSDAYISEDELVTKSLKRTLILDCCREKTILEESFSDSNRTLTKSLSNRIENLAGQKFTVVDSREKFETALAKSSNGYFNGYACLIDQFSSDNPSSGGLFSTELMKVGYKFASKSNPYSYWLPIKNALEQVIENFQSNRLLKEQTPTFKTSMSITSPFAITNLSLY